jgi:hypothetical protein
MTLGVVNIKGEFMLCREMRIFGSRERPRARAFSARTGSFKSRRIGMWEFRSRYEPAAAGRLRL